MTENQSFWQELQGRSHFTTFARRDFLQKAASAALPFLVARSNFELPQKYPKPRFAIGDQILSPYIDDYGDEYESLPSEFGEVMGICWHPTNKQWEYLVNWTSGSGSSDVYPVFDGFLLEECDLRFVSHA